MHVRTLKPGEVELLKSLRLRALAESPDAFADTLGETQERPDAYWEALVASLTEPGGPVMMVAEEAGCPVGLAFGLIDQTDPRCGRVGGMWVNPGLRGRGLGRALLDAIVSWARGRGLTRLTLWVTEGNGPATSLYRRAGFRDTGRREVLPSDSRRPTIEMARDVCASSNGSFVQSER